MPTTVKFSDIVGAILALAYTAGVIVSLGLLMTGSVPAANEKYVLLLLGFIIGAAGTGVAYFLGSSSGSEKKSQTIATLAGDPEAVKIASAVRKAGG